MKKPPPYAPVVSYNGLVSYDLARSPGAFGRDYAPHLFRQWTNLGYTDVQLRNGLGGQVGSGRRFPYYSQMFMFAYIPVIPGQTRGDVGGFVPRGPSPYNVEDWLQAGPGSQPEHPGGPGQIVGSNIIYNPMGG